MGTDGCEVVETLPDPRSFKVHKIIEFDYIIAEVFFGIIFSIKTFRGLLSSHHIVIFEVIACFSGIGLT